MQTVLYFGLILVGIFCSLYFLGLILPKIRIEKRVAYYKSCPKKVYSVVTNNNDYHYRTDLKDLKIIESDGDYEIWDETSKNGHQIRFKTLRKEPYSKYKIKMNAKQFTGYWIGIFKPLKSGGTKYISTEKIEIDNPLFRLLSYLCFDIQKYMEIYQEDLRRKLKE